MGIGFGTKMDSTDMHIAEFLNSTSYKLSDSYGQGHVIPVLDNSLGGTNDLKNANYTSGSNDKVFLEYTRALVTADKYDSNIQLGNSQNLIIAWGNGRLSMHLDYKISKFTIPKANGEVSTNSNDDESAPQFDFWQFHGITLFIFWSGFNFFGYIFARFLKHYTWWNIMHFLGSSITTYFSIGLLGASINYGILIKIKNHINYFS